MLEVAADVEDLGPVELLGRSVPDLAKDADESMMHGCLLSGDPDSLLTTGGEIMFKPLAELNLGQLALCHSGLGHELGDIHWRPFFSRPAPQHANRSPDGLGERPACPSTPVGALVEVSRPGRAQRL